MMSGDQGLEIPDERRHTTSLTPLHLPRRRVPVCVHLSNHRILEGRLYTDVMRPDGTTGRLIDRLNDPIEHYLPLATTDQHLLLNKARIVMVTADRKESSLPVARGTKEFHVAVALSNGMNVEGTVHAFLPPAHSRALDYLNRLSGAFLTLLSGEEAAFISTSHITNVVECTT